MTTTNGIVQTVARKADIATARPQRHTAIRKAAERLSRRNADQAVVELLNEALAACVRLCYEKDDDGQPSSVDAVTARLLVPAPWGRNGGQRWGLRRQESNVLRRAMQARQGDPGLFTYDAARRSWLLNVRDYPSLRAALTYLDKHPVTTTEYRVARAHLLSNG